MHKTKKSIMLSVVFVLVAVLCTFFVIKDKSNYEINWSNELCYDNGILYGIDSAGTQYTIFKYEDSTGDSDLITVSYDSSKISLEVSMPFVDDGNLYVFCQSTPYSGSSGLDDEFQLCYCNFKTGKLEVVSELDPYTAYEVIKTINLEGETTSFIYCVDGYYMYQLQGDDFVQVGMTDLFEKNVVDIRVDYEGNIWGETAMGDIYCQDFNGNSYLAFENDGSVISVKKSPISIDETGVYVTDYETGIQYLIEKENDEFTVITQSQDLTGTENYDNVIWIYTNGDGVSYGNITLDDESIVPVVTGTESYVLENITLQFSDIWIIAILTFLALIVAEFLIVFGLKKSATGKNGVPMFVVFLWLMIPLIIYVAFFAFPKLENTITQGKTEEFYEYLASVAEICEVAVDTEIVQSFSDEEFLTEEMVQDSVNIFYFQGYYYDSDVREFSLFTQMEYLYIYFEKDGELYAGSSDVQLNTPLYEIITLSAYNAAFDALKNGENYLVENVDDNKRFLSILTPIYNDDGEIVAVMEICYNANQMEETITSEVNTLKTVYVWAIVILLLLVTFLIYMSHRSLKKVMSVANLISQGDLSARTNSKQGSEVVRLGRSLDELASKMEHQRDYIKEQEEAYGSFFRNDLFKRLHKEAIGKTKVGENITVSNVTMTVGFTPTEEDVFQRINHEFAPQISFISENHVGDVQIFKDNIKVIFYDNFSAVDNALKVLQLNGGNDCYIALVNQSTKLGVLGTEQRKVVARISMDNIFCVNIGEIATKYKLPLIVSGESSMKIGNFFQDYNLRILGYVKVGYADKLEVIYEVLDGNKQEQMRQKIQTRQLFEDGVALYMAHKPQIAMKKFIQVLYENPNDLVAKQYVLYCQENMDKDYNAYLMEM